MATLIMKKIAEDLNKTRVLDENGALVAYYALLPADFSGGDSKLYLENPTSQRRMYRIYQNMKPFLFPIVPAHDCTVIYLTSDVGVEITVAEHLEEYIYDSQ